MQTKRIGQVLAAVAALATGGAAYADPGCDDMKALCKEATARAAKCVKEQGGEAQCKALIDVREATCAQVDIICKPPVGQTD